MDSFPCSTTIISIHETSRLSSCFSLSHRRGERASSRVGIGLFDQANPPQLHFSFPSWCIVVHKIFPLQLVRLQKCCCCCHDCQNFLLDLSSTLIIFCLINLINLYLFIRSKSLPHNTHSVSVTVCPESQQIYVKSLAEAGCPA